MTPFEQWLSDATKGLSTESAARVRTEIQQHYDSACEDGGDALAALGDPRAANRAYRKVLLTEQEAMLAPVLTQPQRSRVKGSLVGFAALAAYAGSLAGKQHGVGFWTLTIAIFFTLPLIWFFPPATLERCRAYTYIYGIRTVLVVAAAWWYLDSMSAWTLGAICLFFDYFSHYRTLSIFRKVAAGQTYSLLPEEPRLTHIEAIYLRTLETGSPHENVSIAVLFVMLIAMAVWQPATFAPMTAWTAVSFLARRTLPIYTGQRSRWFRIAKWVTMAASAALPVLYHARVPWIGGAYLAFFFWLFDWKSISLRRKLPATQWPKRLYW